MKHAGKLNPAAVKGGTETRKLRVLLAEDTPISAQAMLMMARQLSLEMDVAPNGLEAICMVEAAQAEGKPYDLLLIDVMMPVLDGVETAIRLREQGFDASHLPIVAVTAATDLDEVRSYLASGMQAFLAKPVALNDLRAALTAWGGQSPRRRTLRRPIIAPDAMAALTRQFEERNGRALALIEQTLAAASLDPERIEDVRILLHQIAGTAANFGDRELGDLARERESALVRARIEGDDVRADLELAASMLKQRIAA